MKTTRVIPVLAVIASLAIFACSGLGFSLGSQATAPLPNLSSPSSALSASPLAISPTTASPLNPADIAGLQTAYEAVYQTVNPSVVTIEVLSRSSGSSGQGGFNFGFGGQGNNPNSSGGQVVPTAEGSGVIWDSAGHIVTNNHVVEGSAKLTVTFSDGSSADATVVGTDPNTDLAVIQVNGASSSLLKPIAVGDSTQVKVGQMVVAIGNPFGLANTMTTGIVSAIGRSIDAGPGGGQTGQSVGPSFSIPDVIQTDAAINPGNSGGALVDMSGALIGVPSQIESQSGQNSGIGFAIPSALVKQVATQLIAKGSASHSYLGISGTTITPDVVSSLNLKSQQQGVLVISVISGGPADKAGVQASTLDANGNPTAAGDIIVGIDGKTVTRFEDLVSYLLGSTQPGQTVNLDVLRAGTEQVVKVTLGTQPTP